ncbi:MAG: hypothetical protein LBK25_01335 [Treponema sp.]|jgi:hypothetical protein|nr:hypothetical protein [Treponema sp.]
MKNLFVVASFFLAVSLSAQEKVFAPFVSRLAADVDVNKNLVHLSWIDSPDLKGQVTIYSSDNPINVSTVGSAPEVKAVRVNYGEQFYTEETDYTIRHYFVAASDENGRAYYLAIPFNNFLAVNMKDYVIQRPQRARPAQTPIISDTGFLLNAVAQEKDIAVSFNTAGHSNLVLYRSIQPVQKMEDLSNAVIIQTDAASPFLDYPLPGIAYYYAIVPQDALISGDVKILPGDNATITPVMLTQYELNISDYASMRPTPLPLLSLSALISGAGITNISPQALSPAAERALRDVKRSEIPVVTKQPRALKEDTETSINGEEHTLRSIMQTAFAEKDWNSTREQLMDFLSLPHTDDIEFRTHFYLGQVYYFLNKPQESLFEFLMIKTKYPEETVEWINAVLEMLVRENAS